VQQLAERYSADTVKAAIEEIIDYTENRLKARLSELPDGTWRHVCYLDVNEKVYPLKMAMTKKGDTLHFDFTGTAKQAPAIINSAFSGIEAGVLSRILAMLCWDIPRCPAGVLRCVKFTSEPGTVNNAQYPAGVAKSTTSATFATAIACETCLSKMLAGSEKYADRLMCPWSGSLALQELFGFDQRGAFFATTLLDSIGQAAGAKRDRDGLDVGGIMGGVSCGLADAETYEFVYPLLYLHRRQLTDSGGPGKFRGGVVLSTLWVPYDVDQIPHVGMHAHGMEHPGASGICGGYPGSNNPLAIKRGTNVMELLKEGKLPIDQAELEGKLEACPGFGLTSLKNNDAFFFPVCGAGGYGDPIERDPARVLSDVINRLVSTESAQKIYGVVIDPDTRRVNTNETERRRSEIRDERAKSSKRIEAPLGMGGKASKLVALNEYLEVVEEQGEKLIRCKCGLNICKATENYKNHVLQQAGPVSEAGPWVNPYGVFNRFLFWRHYCPNCLTLLETEVLLKDEPPVWSFQPVV
jgi:N-methylhydantoinase B